MKKRKTKRRKAPTEFIDIRVAEAYYKQERIKEDELLKLIADIYH